MANLDTPVLDFLNAILVNPDRNHPPALRLGVAQTLLAHYTRWAMKGANNELADINRTSQAAIKAIVREIALDETATTEDRLLAARIVLL